VAKTEKVATGMLAYIIAGRNLRPSSPYAKCLLQYYCSNVNTKGSFFKSTFDTAYETGLSERFIYKTNAKWKELGILSWEPGNSFQKKANAYTINLEKLLVAVEKSIRDHDKSVTTKRQKWAERARRYRAKQG